MLTDFGSQFTAEVMKEVSRLLSLQQLTTTPYHPMCNGLVERFHATMKQMLRRMCAERPKEWDKYLPALLFAIREVPQESLGFSPFELLYGRSVRGPMAILRELWSGEVNDEQVLSTYQYVIELRERLEQTCQLARDNLKRSSLSKRLIMISVLDRVSLTSGIRSCYYSQRKVINYYSNGKVRMKWLK